MFKNTRLAWSVAGLLLVVAVVGWVRAGQMGSRAKSAESEIAAQESLRKAAEAYEPARLVSVNLTAHLITYEVPNEVERDGQKFVDYVTQTAIYDPETILIRTNIPEFESYRLNELAPGTAIALKTTLVGDSELTVEELIIP
jgi:hypothetical protein